MKYKYPILYIDDDIIAINKAAGFLAIPDRWDRDAPVIKDQLEHDFGRLFSVHRIDKDTSGVLIYARNADSHSLLNSEFEERRVEKFTSLLSMENLP